MYSRHSTPQWELTHAELLRLHREQLSTWHFPDMFLDYVANHVIHGKGPKQLLRNSQTTHSHVDVFKGLHGGNNTPDQIHIGTFAAADANADAVDPSTALVSGSTIPSNAVFSRR